MSERCETPVMLVFFNRPVHAARCLAAIRQAKPRQLWLVSDGPRVDRPGEAARVAETRRTVESNVDWPCDLRRVYSEQNLGCGRRLPTGLDAVFAECDSAIILEDDCVADASFFRFCSELLERYRGNPQIGAISGDNFQAQRRGTPDEPSYYVSRYPHGWGWATWRRAWQAFDPKILRWPELRAGGWLERRIENPIEVTYWRRIFDKLVHGPMQAHVWDYQWTLACWLNDWLTILPTQNLVSNIGFDAEATHTLRANAAANLPTAPMRFPLIHPAALVRDSVADDFTFQHHFRRPPWWRRAWHKFIHL